MEDQYGPQATIRRNFRGAKILLIEDNPDHCTIIQSVLEQSMPEVDLLIAATGEQALNQLGLCQELEQALPRLILLDLYLPEREDGWKLLQLLKEPESPYRLIPVTLLSHSEEPQDVQMGYDLGISSYIVKPTSFERWLLYFQSLRQYWWQTVTLPLH